MSVQGQDGESIGCRSFLDRVYHYQAGELSTTESQALESHLGDCPGCAKRFAIEDAFLHALRRRVKRAEPPPDLLPRMQRALRRQAGMPWAGPWWSAPWLTAAAASGLIGFVLWFGIGQLTPASVPGAVRTIEREVTVVDEACDRLGRTLAEQRACTDRHHVNALRLADGSYWTIGLVDEPSRALALDREHRGRRLLVEGDLYERPRILHLERVRDLGPARDAARAATAPPTAG
jgi:hypothetical protein